MQHGCIELIPGFIGHDVKDRKKIEAHKSFAARLGVDDKDAFAVELSRDQLQEYVDRWVNAKYAHRKHGGLKGDTPFAKAASWTGPIRQIDNPAALGVLFAPIAGKDGFRTVKQTGIQLDGEHFSHHSLIPLAIVSFTGRTLAIWAVCTFMHKTNILSFASPNAQKRLSIERLSIERLSIERLSIERLGINPGEYVRVKRAEQARRLKEELEPLDRDIGSMKPRDVIEKIIAVNERKHDALVALPHLEELHTTPQIEAAHERLKVSAGPFVPEAWEFTEDEARQK